MAVATPDAPREWTGPQELIERYRNYLTVERGLEPATIATYVRVVTQFLATQRGRELDELSSADVSKFMTSQCRQVSSTASRTPRHRAALVSGIRPGRGVDQQAADRGGPIGGAVERRRAAPRAAPGQVAALLAGCDRHHAIGRRDYAILVLLLRFGLRAAEVSALRLTHLTGAPGRSSFGARTHQERLPLPVDVGKAMVAYLRRGRPADAQRAVFLRAYAPLRGLTPAESARSSAPPENAPGCPRRVGSHRLRHTAATGMLRAGAGLPRSRRSCAIAASRRRCCTPRSITLRCGAGAAVAGEARDEHD